MKYPREANGILQNARRASRRIIGIYPRRSFPGCTSDWPKSQYLSDAGADEVIKSSREFCRMDISTNRQNSASRAARQAHPRMCVPRMCIYVCLRLYNITRFRYPVTSLSPSFFFLSPFSFFETSSRSLAYPALPRRGGIYASQRFVMRDKGVVKRRIFSTTESKFRFCARIAWYVRDKN